MINDKKIPEIRFSGFTDAWEERKLNENVENIGTGRSSFKAGLDYSEQTPYEVLGSTSVISYSDSFDHSGNFVLTARVGANAGNLYKHSGNVKISDNTVYIQSKNLEFIFYLLTKYDLKKLAFGTGQPLIKASELKNLKLFFPKKFGEQQKIGSFFKQLDETIALHQRECDLLLKTKKSYLQKMFPKNGEDKPEIRFVGFNDAWEQRRLEKYFDERSERSSEGELISVTINSGVVKAIDLDRRDSSSEDKSNYKRVEKGDIAYNSMRMWQGASGYSAYSGILSPAYTVITPKEDVHSEFFAYMFKKHELIQTFQKNSQGLTSDTWNLKFPTLKRIKVYAPSYAEQVKIADVLNQLSHLITLHQRELDSLKDMKKSLLQQMFI